MKRIALLTMSIVFLGACAKNGSWNAPAPQTSSEVGTIVSADFKQVDQLVQDQGLQARVISKQQNLYEVFGAQESQILKAIPNAKLTKNIYFEQLIPNKKSKSTRDVYFNEKILSQNFSGLAQDANTQRELKQCLPRSLTPRPVLEIDGQQFRQAMVKMDLGDEVTLDASKSEAHPQVPSDLVIAWAIRGPEFSNVANQGIQISETFSFKPDALGAYEVMLLVQDEEGGCGLSGGLFMVTVNPPYQGQPARPDISNDILKQFPHLDVVNAQQAWALGKGAGISIAVIDSGVDYAHPALLGNIFEFSGEIPENGIDDDGNGYIDDVVGYDFANNDPYPFDDSGHGTHVAGLSSSPYFGSAPHSKVLPVKILNASGGGDLASIVAGIYYAANSGVQIINGSIGAYSRDFMILQEAVDYAESKGILMVFASGNGHPRTGQGVDIDRIPMYPASFENDHILAVGSTDLNERMTFYSNYGKKSVDLLAPGGTPNVPLNSAAAWNPKGQVIIGHMGTSMATPVVAGAAAVIWAQDPSLSALEIKTILMDSSTKKARLSNLISSGGVLDLERATTWQSSGQQTQTKNSFPSIWDLF